MADEPMLNELGYPERCLVAARASLNASVPSASGLLNVKLMNCAIDTMHISTLGDYLLDRSIKEGRQLDLDKKEAFKDDKNLARTFVIPVTLPNGQQIDVVVNKRGQDMACIYKDEQGNEKSFALTPRMKREINENIPSNLEQLVGKEVFEKEFEPRTLDELSEKIQDDELVPKDKAEAVERVGMKLEKSDKAVDTEEQEQEVELPEEIRDEVAKFCSENGYRPEDLMEVRTFSAVKVADKFGDAGIDKNGSEVTMLRFRDGDASKLSNRTVMVQDGRTPVDIRSYDRDAEEFMKRNQGANAQKNTIEESSLVPYKDLDGHTYYIQVHTEPRDLSYAQKEEFEKEMKAIDEETKKIFTSYDVPENSLKIDEEFSRLNTKRLALLKIYGIKDPSIEREIQADNQISSEVSKRIAERKEEKEEKGDGGEMIRTLGPSAKDAERRGLT